MVSNIDVSNILTVSPIELAIFLVDNMTVKVPEYGLNNTINVHGEIEPLLPIVTNKISLCTELYIMVLAAKPPQSETKGNPEAKSVAEGLISKRDQIYRIIQTLESVRESISRMMTAASRNMQTTKFSGV